MDATILTVALVSFFALIVSWLALPSSAPRPTMATVPQGATA
jgi:hypothetical protein